jgi:hypothetical protein
LAGKGFQKDMVEIVNNKILSPTIADVLTKPLAKVRHQALTNAMGLLTIYKVRVKKVKH